VATAAPIVFFVGLGYCIYHRDTKQYDPAVRTERKEAREQARLAVAQVAVAQAEEDHSLKVDAVIAPPTLPELSHRLDQLREMEFSFSLKDYAALADVLGDVKVEKERVKKAMEGLQ
jgi:hypothetical protein